MKKLISIVTPLYNEADNVLELCDRIRRVMLSLNFDYEHICIDNSSTDNTVAKIKHLASTDNRLKLIVNARNFGYNRSSYYGILQSKGDACIMLAADLQDPPEIIPELIDKWEQGSKIVLAVKNESKESKYMFKLRKMYYRFLGSISEVNLIENATGAGLYDSEVVKILREIQVPSPYFRGLLCEIGFPIATVNFIQPKRRLGKSSNNLYELYKVVMLGITSHSLLPLRLMAIAGFLLSLLSILTALFFIIIKLIFWDQFQMGIAPIIIGMFFFGAVQTFFMGLIGEYIGSIHIQVKNFPLVFEKERVNF